MIHNVPASLLPHYRDGEVVVRATDPAELLAAVANEKSLERLVYLQLPALPADIEPLLRWPPPAPLDLMLAAPAADFALLYRGARLVDGRPVRVTIPAVPGFGKAVRVALALQMAVKLDIGQPASDLIPELAEVLELYLHQTTVAQPVEYFHSTWLALFQQQPVTLWTIQEDDPAVFRYVDDAGTERLPGRLADAHDVMNAATFVADLQRTPAAAGGECVDCAFFANCGGYFKWPQRDFDCAGVISLFQTLDQAAAEVRRELAHFDVSRKGTAP